jgi:hypothetical protein
MIARVDIGGLALVVRGGLGKDAPRPMAQLGERLVRG